MVSVFSSWTSPRSERYSHCTGTITPFAATSALIVSRPSDGGVSMTMKSYSARTDCSAFSSARSRPIMLDSASSAPARSIEATARSISR